MKLRELNLLLEAKITSFRDWIERERKRGNNISPQLSTELLHWFQQKLGGDFNKLNQISADLAQQKMKKWYDQLQSKGMQKKGDETLESDDRVVFKTNGLYVMRIRPEDCKDEGEMMGHCVGGYESEVKSGRSIIYSIRDKFGKPHVTIEAKDHDVIVQIKGKQNRPPEKGAYREAVYNFINHGNFRFTFGGRRDYLNILEGKTTTILMQNGKEVSIVDGKIQYSGETSIEQIAEVIEQEAEARLEYLESDQNAESLKYYIIEEYEEDIIDEIELKGDVEEELEERYGDGAGDKLIELIKEYYGDWQELVNANMNKIKSKFSEYYDEYNGLLIRSVNYDNEDDLDIDNMIDDMRNREEKLEIADALEKIEEEKDRDTIDQINRHLENAYISIHTYGLECTVRPDGWLIYYISKDDILEMADELLTEQEEEEE